MCANESWHLQVENTSPLLKYFFFILSLIFSYLYERNVVFTARGIHYKIIIKCFRKEWQVHFRSACRGELYAGTFYTTHPTHAHYPPHTSHPTQVSCSSILFRHLNKTFALSIKQSNLFIATKKNWIWIAKKSNDKAKLESKWFFKQQAKHFRGFLPNKQRVAFYRTFTSLCCGLLVVLKTERKVFGVARSGLVLFGLMTPLLMWYRCRSLIE